MYQSTVWPTYYYTVANSPCKCRYRERKERKRRKKRNRVQVVTCTDIRLHYKEKGKTVMQQRAGCQMEKLRLLLSMHLKLHDRVSH